MDLTITEVATLLGTTERAVRARLTRGTLKGSKRGGRWLVPREALPVDPTARHRARGKADRVRAAVEAGLTRGKQLPVQELTPFRAALAVLRDQDMLLAAKPGVDQAAARAEVATGLTALSEGHHHFLAEPKRVAFRAARAAFARAIAWLIIADAPEALLRALEEEVLPPLAGLIRWAGGLDSPA